MPQPEVKSCGILVVHGDPIDSFLLMKHADRWDLPKGHVDPGETELECAYREFEEETGLARELLKLDSDFCFREQYYVPRRKNNGRRLKELVIFLGSVPERYELQLTEHIGSEWWKWKPPHKIQSNTIDPLLKAVAKHLRE